MMTKVLILFQNLIYDERSLADFYSSSTRTGIYFPQSFPLLPTKALMRLCVSLRVYTIYLLSQQECPKYHRNRCVFMRTFPSKNVVMSPYMRTFPKGSVESRGNTSFKGLQQQNCLPVSQTSHFGQKSSD